MTEIYLHIVARMADYMATHPYNAGSSACIAARFEGRRNGSSHGKSLGGSSVVMAAVDDGVKIGHHGEGCKPGTRERGRCRGCTISSLSTCISR